MSEISWTAREIAGGIAGLLSASAFVPYLVAVVRRETRPSLASWMIWTAVGALLCASYWASGARAAIWVSVSYVLGPLLTLGFCLKYGERTWTRFDLGCLFAAALSLVLWGVTGDPVVALALNVGIDLLGALPTIRKSWSDPGSEDRTAWALFMSGNIVNLFALDSWAPRMSAYPLYLFAVTVVVNVLLSRPRASV